MNQKGLDRFTELLNDPESIRPEMLEGIVLQMFTLFNDLKANMASEDEQVRLEATQMAGELKTKLEEQAYQLCQTAGIDTTALEDYMNNPTHFSKEEWETMNTAKDTFHEINQKFNSTEKEGV